MTNRGPDELARARQLGIETCGRIAAFWGFTRTMGRVFGLLYLSPTPLSRAEIQAQLEISVGSASMTLSALARWGVVHKVRIDGQRGDRYRSETDFWKMIARVLNERERHEIQAAVANVKEATTLARGAGQAAAHLGRTAAREEAHFVLDRLRRLRVLSQMGETMLNMLLGELSLDVGRFLSVFRGDIAASRADRTRNPQ